MDESEERLLSVILVIVVAYIVYSVASYPHDVPKKCDAECIAAHEEYIDKMSGYDPFSD